MAMKHLAQTAGIPKACEICNCRKLQIRIYQERRSDLTLANYAEVFQINGLIGFLVNSVVIATCTTLFCGVCGQLSRVR